MMNTIDTLKQLESDYQAQKSALEQEFAKKKSLALQTVKDTILDLFIKADANLAALPDSERTSFYKEEAFREVFKSLKLTPREEVRTRNTNTDSNKRTRTSDAEILNYLAKERTTKDIIRDLNLSSVTVSKRLNKLLGEQKVMKMSDGRQNSWVKA